MTETQQAEDHTKQTSEVIEVKYSDGATPLFLAIEETSWEKALDICESNPEQVRIWVRSTGTENTTFAWSMWRRLPIHEVRVSTRQYTILSAFNKAGVERIQRSHHLIASCSRRLAVAKLLPGLYHLCSLSSLSLPT